MKIKKFNELETLYIFDKNNKVVPSDIIDTSDKIKSDIDDIILELIDEGYNVESIASKYQLPLNLKIGNKYYNILDEKDHNKNYTVFILEINNLKDHDLYDLKSLRKKITFRQEPTLISTILRLEDYYKDNIIDVNNPFIGFNWELQNWNTDSDDDDDDKYDQESVLIICMNFGIIKDQ